MTASSPTSTSFSPLESPRLRLDFLLCLWGSALLLSPFYFFPSGLPQPADLILIVLVTLLVALRGFRIQAAHVAVVQTLGWFVLYIFVVNLSYAVLTARLSLAVNSFYYLFNFLVFTAFMVLYNVYGRAFVKFTMQVISFSVIAQVLLSFFLTSEGFRQSLFFNNPNQLGYYGLISTALFSYGARTVEVSTLHRVIFYLAAVYLTSLSLSKAAIAATVILVVLVFVHRPRFAILLIVLAAAALSYTTPGQSLWVNLERRGNSLGQADDSLLGRGYDRIVNHPEYLPFGAGEGAFDRFRSVLSGREMHSSWGTILFSYGLIGSLLFVCFLGLVFWHGGAAALLYFLPIFFYGLTHNGARFTLFWLFLAFMICASPQVTVPVAPRKATP